MADQKQVHELTRALTTSETTFDIVGDFIYIWSLATTATVFIDDRNPIQVRQGSLITVEPFSRVNIIGATAQDITIKYGFGRYTELSAQITLDPDQEAIEVYQEGSDTIATTAKTSIPATTNVLAVASDGTGNRRDVYIIAPVDNTASIWIREDSATTEGGIALGQGEKFVTNTAAALYIYNPDAAAQEYSTFVESVS